jgi:hypothetical protein
MMLHALRAQPNAHGSQVSREELLRYVEAQFDAADVNRDGNLDVDDLRLFLKLICHPKLETRT